MNAILALLLVAAGVDYGYQPYEEGPPGQLEYIIQLSPDAVDSLEAGLDVTSEIEEKLRGVRRFRIRVGTGPVPRLGIAMRKPSVPSPPSLSGPLLAEDPHDHTPQAAPAFFSDPIPPDPAQLPQGNKADIIPTEVTAEKGQQQTPSDQKPPEKTETKTPVNPGESPRPWWALTATLLGLFASGGLNVYLGWLVVDLHGRARSRVAEDDDK